MNNNKKVIVEEKDLLARYSEEIINNIKKVRKQIVILWKDKKYAELLEFGLKEIEKLPNEPKGDGNKQISEIYFLIASSMLETGADKSQVKEMAIKSANFDRESKNALWLLREVNNQYSDNSVYFKIKVEGSFYLFVKDQVIEQPFKTVYGVNAESEDEALEFVKEFERKEVSDSLKILKANETSKKPELPKGVYETMRLIVKVEENKDDNTTEIFDN